MNKFKTVCITSFFFTFLFIFFTPSHAAQKPPIHTSEESVPLNFLARALNVSVGSPELNNIKKQTQALTKKWGAYHAYRILYTVGCYFRGAYTTDPTQQALSTRLNVAQSLITSLEYIDTQNPSLSSHPPFRPHANFPSWVLFYTIITYLPGYSVADHRAHFSTILNLFYDCQYNYNAVLYSLAWANHFFDRNHHSIPLFVDLARACFKHFNPLGREYLRSAYQQHQKTPWHPQETLEKLHGILNPSWAFAASAA